jgi:hypothetical protein
MSTNGLTEDDTKEECKQQQQPVNSSIFDIFMKEETSGSNDKLKDLMEMEQVQGKPFLELAYHLDQSSSSSLLQTLDDESKTTNPYINQLKKLKLVQICDLLETMAYCNFNSCLVVDQLIWLIGKTKKLHHSFLDVKIINYNYQVVSISENQIVREELKKRLIKTPYCPEIYNCRFSKMDRLYLIRYIESGNLRLIKWIIQKQKIKPDSHLLDWACRNKQLQVFTYIKDTYAVRPTQSGADYACMHGNLELVKYIFETFGVDPSSYGVVCACSEGYLEIVQYVYETCKVEPDSNQIDCACKHGHLKIVQYIYAFTQGKMKPNVGIVDYACSSGFLELVQYVNETCGVQPTLRGTNFASEYGHINIVKYNNEACGIKPNSTTADSACLNKKMEVLKDLHETYNIEPTSNGFVWACSAGNLEVVNI